MALKFDKVQLRKVSWEDYMFVKENTYKSLKDLVLSKEEFQPCPSIEDRDSWESIPQDIKETVLREAEKYVGMRYSVVHATDLMSYLEEGSREPCSKVSNIKREALNHLVLAECIENKGNYIRDIINAVWALCEQSSWVSVYHYYLYRTPEPTMFPPHEQYAIDLGCSENAIALAFTYQLLKEKMDEISPLIARRLKYEIKRRIIDPFLYTRQWWWMGYSGRKVNNWAPWCSSNCLMTILLVEEDEELRRKAVFKTLEIMDKFVEIYSEDGGCDEGPGYWNRAGGSLFDCLWIINEATKGQVDFFNSELIKNIGEFPAKVHVAKTAFTNFADSKPYLDTDFSLLNRYGSAVKSPEILDLANTMYKELGESSPGGLGVLRSLPYLFTVEAFRKKEKESLDIQLTHVFDGIQVMTTRQDQNKEEGFYVAIKGGHNDESHNHNDLGNFILYHDGSPCVVDVGAGTYVKDTFGPNRYSIWNMQGQYHNIPVIGGNQQMYGKDYEARDFKVCQTGSASKCSMNLKEAYPSETPLLSYTREMALHRDQKTVSLTDTIQLTEKNKVAWHFMLCKEPRIEEGKVYLTTPKGDQVQLVCEGIKTKISYEVIPLDDPQLRQNWGDTLYRLCIETEECIENSVCIFTFEKI